MMSKKSPQLRFEGFTDDWEERKFSDIVVRLNKSSNNNQLPKVEFEDIIAGEGRLNKDISRKFDDRKGTLFEPDNILYGKLRPYLKNWLFSDFKGIALGDFWVFKSINSEPKFVYSLIQADNYQRVANDTSGTKMPRSDWKKVSSSNFSIPTSLEEQQKIGQFFKQLDDTIALHQRKLDLLKEQKKGYLQKMFPKNGEKVPELRFKGFTDDWEERKLGDITKISTGKLDANAMVENGKYDFYTSGIKKYRTDVAAFEGPSITIAGNGATVGYMHLADNKFNAYQRTYVLQEFLVDRSFIFSEIGNKLPKKIKQEARTGNIPYIVMDMLTELKLSIPQNNSEQQKIGSFFKQLDETIALHQRKLDLLKEQKKGFLQKMFV